MPTESDKLESDRGNVDPMVVTLDDDDDDSDDLNDNVIKPGEEKQAAGNVTRGANPNSSYSIFKTTKRPVSSISKQPHGASKNKTPVTTPRVKDGIIGMKVRSPSG